MSRYYDRDFSQAARDYFEAQGEISWVKLLVATLICCVLAFLLHHYMTSGPAPVRAEIRKLERRFERLVPPPPPPRHEKVQAFRAKPPSTGFHFLRVASPASRRPLRWQEGVRALLAKENRTREDIRALSALIEEATPPLGKQSRRFSELADAETGSGSTDEDGAVLGLVVPKPLPNP